MPPHRATLTILGAAVRQVKKRTPLPSPYSSAQRRCGTAGHQHAAWSDEVGPISMSYRRNTHLKTFWRTTSSLTNCCETRSHRVSKHLARLRNKVRTLRSGWLDLRWNCATKQ